MNTSNIKIVKVTREYEAWLKKQIPQLVRADLKKKHIDMASKEPIFFRAAFYFWIVLWLEKMEAQFSWAHIVFSIGDVHVDNYGNWRDKIARLQWGLNDRDEVYPLRWVHDLMRLTVSTWLAIEDGHLSISEEDAADAVWTGYVNGIESGGQPFILEERHPHLRQLAVERLKDPSQFWNKLEEETRKSRLSVVPASAMASLRKLLPDPDMKFTVSHRTAGEGSLGRPRFVAVGEWNGGLVAREVKALAPSACVFAGVDGPKKSLYKDALGNPFADPRVHVGKGWIGRELSPTCSHIELSSLPYETDERKLIECMGFDIANFHLLTAGAKEKIGGQIADRGNSWLAPACKKMKKGLHKAFEDWRIVEDAIG